MKVVQMTFNVLPYVDDFPGQSKVSIRRDAFTDDQVEDFVRAANALGAREILIETPSEKPSAPPDDPR